MRKKNVKYIITRTKLGVDIGFCIKMLENNWMTTIFYHFFTT